MANPLIQAARRGNATALKALLKSPGAGALAKLGLRTSGETALIAAAHAGHADCVALLLPLSDVCANVHRVGNTGDALMIAARAGHEGCVRVLAPATLAEPDNWQWREPLRLAAIFGHHECVSALLEHPRGAQGALEACGRMGMTPLMSAAHNGHGKCVKALMPFSELSRTNFDGQTALGIAFQKGDPESVAMLAAACNAADLLKFATSAMDATPDGRAAGLDPIRADCLDRILCVNLPATSDFAGAHHHLQSVALERCGPELLPRTLAIVESRELSRALEDGRRETARIDAMKANRVAVGAQTGAAMGSEPTASVSTTQSPSLGRAPARAASSATLMPGAAGRGSHRFLVRVPARSSPGQAVFVASSLGLLGAVGRRRQLPRVGARRKATRL